LLEAVTPQLPGVSLATVYATLELLEELGMTRRVPMPGGVTVFDSRTDPHHHTRCRRCGAVHDLDAPLATDTAVAAAEQVGFHADEATLTLTGVCAGCR
jgi:Fe2+ or Zn2+ uptake regulation protein